MTGKYENFYNLFLKFVYLFIFVLFLKGMKMMCDHKNHREPLSTVAMSVDNLWVLILFSLSLNAL